MLLSVVLLSAFLVVPGDALGETEKAFVMGGVRCKEPFRPICRRKGCPRPVERVPQTIEIEVGQENDDVFTIVASYTVEENVRIRNLTTYDYKNGGLVFHFRHACPYGATKKETVLRGVLPVHTDPVTFDFGLVEL